MADIFGQANGQTITGTASSDNIYAGGYDLTVKAGEGNDYIEGGFATPYGSHQLFYGEGGDDFIVIQPADGHRADPWSLADGGSGTDTAYVDFHNFGSPLFYTHNSVSADIHCGRLAGRLVSMEKIIFQGGFASDQITGGSGDDAIFGNRGDDKIDGGGGNDVLSGGDGTDTVTGGDGNDGIRFDASGNDTLDGGLGNDTLDFYTEWNYAGVTVDLRKTGVQIIDGRSITLKGFENVFGTDFADTLTLTNAGGVIQAAGGNDILIGGTGIDTLFGGSGNDVYYVDNVQDRVVETKSLTDLTDAGGIDVVRSSVSFALSADGTARFVENLQLRGTAAINGTGNDLANVITGNAAANVLTGLGGSDTLNGGAGADTMIGGLGNDRYVVDNAGDVVTEVAGQGTDLVIASVTCTLAANVEKLTLSGTAAIDGTGNGDANVLTGNAAANVLAGMDGNDTLTAGLGNDTLLGGAGNDRLIGGDGNDTLNGGAGADTFKFATAPNATTNLDTVQDFTSGSDVLAFSKAAFKAFTALGAISMDAFWSGAGVNTAHDATDRFIYNTATGALWYDADGTGSAAAVQVATLTGHPALAFTDMQIVV